MQFLFPKEPLLFWDMLYPVQRRELPPPLNVKPVHHLFWARNAIYHGIRALGVSPGECVLAPSFHCATAIEPILKCGARVKFYNVRRDCSPDFNDIEAKIDSKTRAVLAIHYFGFPQPIREFQQLCRDHRLYLIEDCAHVLTGETDGDLLGTFGDISIFSWRKFLPLYDGGQLVVNNPALKVDIPWARNSLLFNVKVGKNILDKLTEASRSKTVKVMSRVLDVPQSLGRRLLSVSRRQGAVLSIENQSVDFDPSLTNVRMSGFSRHILRNMDIPAIREKRRINSAYLLTELKSLPGITALFTRLPEGVCPWAFPVLSAGRPGFHAFLRSKGIPTYSWSGVIHRELPIEEFPDAEFLYQNLVFLPVHQNIGEPEIGAMIQAMADASAVKSGSAASRKPS